MSEPVRIGFIGCGGNARGHMAGVKRLTHARVTAVCDTVEELAQQAAATCDATAYTDLHRMLDEADLDAVYLSLPVFAHGEPEKAVIQRGLPFLVEKPVARHMDTALEIEALVKASGLLTAVGYQLRYSTTVDKAREILSGRQVGLCAGTYWCGTGRLPADRWTVQFDKSGGQLLEQATHTIDMMRYLVGNITEVHAWSERRILNHITSPDANVVTWRYANGALGSLTTSWAMDPSDWRFANQIDITGDALHLHWSAPQLLVKRGDSEVEEYANTGPTLDDVFCRAVQTNDRSLIRADYSAGVDSMAVSIAALESARLGRSIELASLR